MHLQRKVIPGGAWKDNRDILLQAHGGGIIRIGSTWYWFGEDKTGKDAADAFFLHVSCYTSTDLVNWTFVKHVLTRQAGGDLGPGRIVERPKVLYNNTTGQYVMYLHIDNANYTEAKVGIATSSSIDGDYLYRGSFRPLGFQSRNIGLFQDTDGTAYLLSEDRAHGLRIIQLSADYLSVVRTVVVLADYESPAMFKANGLYYLLASHLTGWETNDNHYAIAPSLDGPWSSWSDFAPPGSHTFHSQTTFVFPVTGSAGTTFVYMGDRWNTADLGASPYIWLPLQVNGAMVSLSWYDAWSIDMATGLWNPVQR